MGPIHNIEILPGDVIQSYCIYDNDNDFDVKFGSGTNEEMCSFNIVYYPALETQPG